MMDELEAGETSAMGDAAAGAEGRDAAAKLEQLQGDKDYMASYLDGDRQKFAELTRLRELVHNKQPDPETARANRELFPVPAEPHEYRINFTEGEVPTKESMELAREVQEALHAEEVPMNVVNLGRELITRNGVLDEPALAEARTRGLRELESQHGAKGAAAMLKEGRAIFERIAKRSERLAHMIDASGAGSDPHFIATLVRTYRARQGR